MEAEIEGLLAKLSSLVENMGKFVQRGGSSNPALAHTLQRHREILHDYSYEFKKTKASIKQARESAHLLSNVRNEIRTHASQNQSRMDHLLRERNALQQSGHAADEVIDAAAEARQSLLHQRTYLENARSGLGSIGSAVMPAINSIVGTIARKKQRDQLILAAVAATCIILIFFYWSNKS